MFTQGSEQGAERATSGGGAISVASTYSRLPVTTVAGSTEVDDVSLVSTSLPRTRDVAPRVERRRLRGIQLSLAFADLIAAAVASGVVGLLWFGEKSSGFSGVANWVVAAALPVLWVAMLLASRSYESRFLGAGPAEFERVFRAFLNLIVLITFTSYAVKMHISRGFVLFALPAMLILTFVGRTAARQLLRRLRERGQVTTSVVAVGDARSVQRFAEQLARDPGAGMLVVGGCIPDVDQPDDHSAELARLRSNDLQYLGNVDSIVDAVQLTGASSVAVVSSKITPERLQWIAWQLEGADVDLFVSPALTEVAGRRLHIQQVGSLPLLHVAEPEFHGVRRLMKAIFDRTVAGLALIVLAPVLVALALAVRLSSRGPAFFLQSRVGKNGREFRILKFRTMHVGSEREVTELVVMNDAADGLLFKIRKDPRITKVGRLLRRYSLDELPQLINVVLGSMSLVGPRPPLPSEVAQYETNVHRRLLVKPGLTGLWQVSGRSDLSWEESVRLDLRYVENWSLSLDVVVLLRTLTAVVRGRGAY